LYLAAGAAVLMASSHAGWTQTYPNRPVRIVVTFPAGGSNDIHARIFGQILQEQLGQPFIVENKPGGGGNVGTAEAMRAAPDGHTILYMSTSLAINAAAYQKLTFNLIQDIAPVSALYRANYVMVVHPSFPAKTVREFIRYAKANPGKINFGSQGIGATGHLAGEMFKQLTGTDLFHVPYRGQPQALNDLIGGQIHVQFADSTTSIPLIKDGKLRALAVTSGARSMALPDVPIMAESVPGFELFSWAGMGVPKGTATTIVNVLNSKINAGLARAEVRSKYADLGLDPYPVSPAQFAELVADDVTRWRGVVHAAGVKLD
jgi:tripartite-type tricarboxylate transporter receptor subunit TctC